ncbi:hypothetical protein [Hymenobacter sp. GOD-10R]|uniref:hypothetical protein n=1 Tax=Hymenobacter sp. GOD-10R TaxID=3093922 RepID=UPI002D79036A|nr:hypothetical protein [Hymenobacter sp. GOD-10R]WRQ26685.1 hypothetical protein SD425_16555 [Hymenobacter sp. GOD-10R]
MKHGLLLASSLILAQTQSTRQETKCLNEQRPPEPLQPGCSDDMPIVDVRCGEELYFTRNPEAFAAAFPEPEPFPIKPVDTYTWGPSEVSAKAAYARSLEPKHSSAYTKPITSPKARKAARRRAKAGRKASR